MPAKIDINALKIFTKSRTNAEASLEMVAPGAGFRGGALYGPKYRWRPKKKGLRCKTSWFSVRKYVMYWWPKTKEKERSLPTNQWVLRKKKPNGVTPKWWHPGRAAPPSDATEQMRLNFSKKLKTTSLNSRLTGSKKEGYPYTSQKNISLNVLFPELTFVRKDICLNEHLPEITSA